MPIFSTPATPDERRVLTATVFVAGCLLFFPQEWTAGSVLVGVSALLLVRDRVLLKREAERARAAAPAVVASDAGDPSASEDEARRAHG